MPEDRHSIKETEHRFTALEEFRKESSSDRQELHDIVEQHTEKLQTHERCIIALTMALSVLLQEQFPKLAGLLKHAFP
jgi:hypothetical protein